MATEDRQANSGTSAGFWTIRHVAFGLGGLGLLIVLMVRSCGGDESDKQAKDGDEDLPRQAIVVQIPASQWPSQPAPPVQSPTPRQQPGYGYMPQQPDYEYAPRQQVLVQPQAPADDGGNPWAVPSQSYGSGQTGGYRQPAAPRWGQQTQPQRPQQPQYVQPQGGARYRPLDEPEDRQAESRKLPEPVQGYYPVAPYDRPAGSSFSTPGYPYAGGPYGGYSGYYNPGYGLPGSGYGVSPGVPGIGWRPGW
jgi:hypothetical protein